MPGEPIFRANSEAQSLPAAGRRQFLFGMVHSVFAGVPLAVGIALTAAGMYFRWVYLRSYVTSLAAADPAELASSARFSKPRSDAGNAAVYRAAAAHAVYNWLLLSVVVITAAVVVLNGGHL